ncbi:hypothetical protein PACTADRAFT_28927, partial [Pachysolen tannophilus NRRL Y-2460]
LDKSIAKGLHDRLYDKRKAAALELEKVIKQCLAEGNSPKIREIINDLCCGYAYAVHQPNARNGGLIGLAAAAIALGQNEVANYLEDIIHPVLACFGDQDARVRYYACEALYNISKVAKGEVLLYFNEIFDVLCKLSSDSEMSVKKGADLLDRLIKDIVAEKAATYVSVLQTRDPTELLKNNTIVDSDGKTLQINEPQEPTAFNLQKFIPLLTERIFVINPFTRMFLVSWIKLLDSIPDLELVSYLPTFLGGLISFLSDTHKDVRVVTHNLLDLFLHEIRRISEIKEFVEERDKQLELKRKNHENGSEPTNNSLENVSKKIQDEETNDNVYEDPDDTSTSEGALYIPGQDVVLDYPRIIDILISHLDSSEEEIQLVVLSWIETLLEISSQSFLDYIPKLLMVLLQTMANESEQLRENSKLVNNHLMELVLNLDEEQDKRLNYSPIINTLILHFTNEKPITRVASIDWLTMLHNKNPKQLLEHGDNTFLTLLKALSDQSEEVINKDLQLLSKISNESDDVYFNSFMSDLLTLFKNDRKLLETRGSFIIRTMCISLNPERIFKSLAEVLEEEKDLNFVSIIIQILNNNLLTAPELNKLRKKLTSLTTSDSVSNNEGWITFSTLFKSWCHNPAAALSLCLISQNYQLAYNILTELVEYEITINLLVQLDILIQLLESPVFTKLRLQLLEAEKYPYLYKCLYGILMLLPQSLAFKTLQNRLNSVGPI